MGKEFVIDYIEFTYSRGRNVVRVYCIKEQQEFAIDVRIIRDGNGNFANIALVGFINIAQDEGVEIYKNHWKEIEEYIKDKIT